ncbi:putative uncharacterized protein [Prevotella sp. CAG:617]|nr:putative uncharacterized protein [Prevotella sp. CAG:617]
MNISPRHLIFTLLLGGLLTACKQEAVVPTDSRPATAALQMYPDYRDVTLPPNIAPLNFMVRNAADNYVATFEAKGRQAVAGREDGKIEIDTTEWRALTRAARGGDIKVTVYAETDGTWQRYPEYTLHVAQEDIDPYLSYRLIEPGYELYRQVGLYQRNLTNFEVQTIYENNRAPEREDDHCVNCHNYQNYSTARMLFHVRGNHGGTILAENGKIRRLALKGDSILSAAVYPSWHPTKNLLVFSTNKTGQAFHTLDKQKIEVMDEASDLIFYDVDHNTVRNIIRTPGTLENFPCWSPDGRKVYYCAATLPDLKTQPNSLHSRIIVNQYDSLRYNLMSIDFDERTQTFSNPQLVVDCVAMNKSVSVPRVSPDGRYLLFTLGDFGQFHIWHKSSDLYVKDLQTGRVYPLTEANSPDVDSYHTWSSNGRWIVFSSRRDDGSYTRPYIAYFDRQGRAHRAFMLPQEDPETNLLLMKSYNVPELTRDAVRYSPEDFKKAVYGPDEPVRNEEKQPIRTEIP